MIAVKDLGPKTGQDILKDLWRWRWAQISSDRSVFSVCLTYSSVWQSAILTFLKTMRKAKGIYQALKKTSWSGYLDTGRVAAYTAGNTDVNFGRQLYHYTVTLWRQTVTLFIVRHAVCQSSVNGLKYVLPFFQYLRHNRKTCKGFLTSLRLSGKKSCLFVLADFSSSCSSSPSKLASMQYCIL